jgi:hypothetical protein
MAGRPAPQPPFDTDLLADLHADNVPPELSGPLWSRVREDPEALRFLSLLDDVGAELRALGSDPQVLHPIPAELTHRLDRLLDDLSQSEPHTERVATVHRLPFTGPPPESSASQSPSSQSPSSQVPPSEVPSSQPPSSHRAAPNAPMPMSRFRSRRMRWIVVAAASAAVLAGTLAGIEAVRGRQVSPNALPAKESGTIQLNDDLPAAQVLGAMGRSDLTGPLAAPGAVTACVAAAGLDRSVLGSMNVTYHGKPAALILLTGPHPPKITALVVGIHCAPGDPEVLEIRDIG